MNIKRKKYLPRTDGYKMKIHSSHDFTFIDCNSIIVICIITFLFLYLALLSSLALILFKVGYLIIEIAIHIL